MCKYILLFLKVQVYKLLYFFVVKIDSYLYKYKYLIFIIIKKIEIKDNF